MLSFEPASPDAYILAHGESTKTKERFDIWFNPIYGPSEGLVDITDPAPVLMTQEDYALEKYHVSPETFREIVQSVVAGGAGTRYTRNKRLCHRYLAKYLKKVAKTELDFSDDKNNITLSVALDTSRKAGESKKSYVAVAVGSTGAGKTWSMVNQYLLQDKNKRKRRYFFFSAVPADSSLKNLIKFANKNALEPRFFRVDLAPEQDQEDEEWEPPKLELKDYQAGDVLFFDDVESMPRSNPWREDVLQLMINGCQRARHDEIMVVASSHHMKNYRLTRNLLGAAKYVLLFPRANKRAFQFQILEEELAFPKQAAKEMCARIARQSRWCLYHKHSPQHFITQKSVILL